MSWGFEEEVGVQDSPELGIHNCTHEELGIGKRDPDKAKFYPIHPNSYKDVEHFSKKLKCFNDKFEIQGDYNSEKAKILKITFEKCNNTTI